MNHSYIYNSIILRSKQRVNPNIVEKHHIVPKSLGGTDDDINIAYLTPREHFICHKLLIKIHSGEAKRKMSYALWRMCHNPKNHSRIVSSRDYSFARKNHVSSMKTRTISEQTRNKLSESLKGRETPWAINNIPKDLPYNGNAKVWDITDPRGVVHRLIGHEFSSFCKTHLLSQGNLSSNGKTKGYSAICHGNYYQWIKNQR